MAIGASHATCSFHSIPDAVPSRRSRARLQEELRVGGKVGRATAPAKASTASDVTAEPGDRACDLLHEILACLLLGIGERLSPERLDLPHVEAGGLKLRYRRERPTHQAAAEHSKESAAARAVAPIAVGELGGAGQAREELSHLLLVALRADEREEDSERLLGADCIEAGGVDDSGDEFLHETERIDRPDVL